MSEKARRIEYENNGEFVKMGLGKTGFPDGWRQDKACPASSTGGFPERLSAASPRMEPQGRDGWRWWCPGAIIPHAVDGTLRGNPFARHLDSPNE